MPSEPSPLDPTPRPAERIARLRADQCERWQRGERVGVAAYCARFPDLLDDGQGLLDLVHNEWLLRQRRGETVSLDEYLLLFPQYAEQLRRQLARYERLRTRGPAAGELYPVLPREEAPSPDAWEATA